MNKTIIALLIVCIFAISSISANSKPPEYCNEPRETGPCKARMLRWGYNPSCRKCVEFTYGGCKGNKNNFETKEKCEKVCKS